MLIVKVQDEEGTTLFAANAISFMADGTCVMTRFTGQPDPAALRSDLTGSVTVYSPGGSVIEHHHIQKEKVDG